jgi:plastocyanin
MRTNRLLLIPVTALIALGLAGPATAADFGIGVTDFDFTPGEQKIAVGDRVIWTFTDGGHTTTANRGQPDSWDSDLENSGATFEHTFTKPGRYQYICTPHESFMKGEIVVGEDAERDTVDGFKTKRVGKRATISFTLNEAASMTYSLKGPSKRTVKRKRLKAGKQSFTVKRLKKGSYTGTLTLTDDFDKRATQKKSFKVR